MKTHLKLLALFLMLIMLVQSTVISTFALVHIDVDDTSVILNATGTQPSKYSSQYNSGQRNVVATTLNGTSATSYYSGNYAYNVLSEKSMNEIRSSLTSLMTSTHSYKSSYDDCHYKADRTDCENENGKVSLIYSSYSATMSQWNGWNREHVWPQSLGGDNTSGGGADLHHIRPSDASLNSSRGNKKYGNAVGGTAKYGSNPAQGVLGGYSNSTYFEPLDHVKGDVARIILYVWIRWGASWGATDVTKVFQSIDVLLSWCELDPVDTWELGRNEVVQDIQGNRNVFIDYPEYAWLVFGKEIPSDMVTPSGEAQSNGHHWNSGEITVQATCTTTGVKTYKCTDSGCNETKTETIKALGHSMGAATVTKEADCLNKGEKVASCTRSGCTYKTTTTINALGHAWGNWIIDKEATETELGAKHHVCSRCQTEETGTIPLLGHECTYTTVVTPPTCTERGYTTYTCTGVGCGNVEVKDYVDMIPHNYEYGVCTVCTAQDPNAPTYTADDLRSIVTRLVSGTYSGKEYYNKICEAIAIYNSFSPAKKEEVSGLYRTLTTIIAQYNNEVASVNEEADALGFALPSTTVVSAEVLCFAVYSLLNKKYI